VIRMVLSVVLTLGFAAVGQVSTTGATGARTPLTQDQQPTPPAKQLPPARIEGTVVNAATGEPLKRANVTLMPADGRADANAYHSSTDAAGRFSVVNIPPGNYRLWAVRTGYVRTEYGSKAHWRPGSTIAIAPGQELSKLDMRLEPHGVIAGRITDEEGEPLAYVQVQTMMFRYFQGKRQLAPAGSASTNDLGEYRIFGLPPGRYYLSATHQNMMSPGTISASGRNEPDEGFAATFYPGSTDARTATMLQVHAGRPLTGVDMRLLRTRTIRIVGRLSNFKTHPMNRPMIMLVPRDAGYAMFERNMAMPRPDGSFEMRGVTPGAYYIIAQAYDGTESRSGRVAVDAGSSDIEGIEVPLMPGQELAGTIRVEGDSSPTVLSGIRLMLQPKDFTPFSGGSSATPKEDGTFVFRNVTPDTFRIRAYGPKGPAYVKSIFVGQQEAKDGEVVIQAGASPVLSIVVSTAGGQVTGGVKGENEALPQRATVVLVPSNRQRPDLYRSATTDQYGKFSISTIAPGEYKLFAWDDVEQDQWLDPDFIQLHENSGKSISIREVSKEAVDLQILKSQSAAAPGQ
jgi:hypothetical protein